MNVDRYVDRIEGSDRNDETLERISAEIVADATLGNDAVLELDGWIGQYMADNDREREPSGGWGPDDAPDDGPSLIERRHHGTP